MRRSSVRWSEMAGSSVPSKLLTTAQAAVRLGISPARVRALVAAGRLEPAVHEPRWMMFTAAEVARFAAIARPAGKHR